MNSESGDTNETLFPPIVIFPPVLIVELTYM